ncbi:MAG TPA: hypothetical protein PK694_10810 [Rhodospirillales bacterium]|jgi:hypothetical protein|nr:hypothetical protein [Rhodospirillales bacterium]
MRKTIAVMMLAAVCCGVFGVAGASPADPDVEAEDEELRKSYEEIDRMLQDDDPRAPIDYGYGPGVLPPDHGGPGSQGGAGGRSGR